MTTDTSTADRLKYSTADTCMDILDDNPELSNDDICGALFNLFEQVARQEEVVMKMTWTQKNHETQHRIGAR